MFRSPARERELSALDPCGDARLGALRVEILRGDGPDAEAQPIGTIAWKASR